MTPSARFALAIALTNIPQGDDWSLIHRLAKIYARGQKKTYHKLTYLIKQNEVYNIPEIIKIISIDINEYNHLMTCLYKNGLARGDQGDEGNEEIHGKEEYWQVDDLEAKGFEKLCASKI